MSTISDKTPPVPVTIRLEVTVGAPAATVWDAIRDYGAVHQRLARGFVTDVTTEPDARIVTFANGMRIRELITDIDDDARRLAYAAVGGRASSHGAFMQVLDDGAGCRILWQTEVLPAEVAGPVEEMMKAGAQAMRATLEADHGQS